MDIEIRGYTIHEVINYVEDLVISFEEASLITKGLFCKTAFVWKFEIEGGYFKNECVYKRLPKQVYWEGREGITEEMLDDDINLPSIPNTFPAPTLQEIIEEIEEIVQKDFYEYCNKNMMYPKNVSEAFSVYRMLKGF